MDPTELARLVQKLLEKGGSLQSAEGGGPLTPQEVRNGVIAKIQVAMADHPESGHKLASLTEAELAANQVVSTADRAIEKLKGGKSASTLRDDELDALQAIVEVIGRPALRYLDGRVQPPSSRTGENEI